MTRKKCVIFDMDGVIINSEPIHQECERKIFDLLKISVSEEEHNSLVGATDETMWNRLGKLHHLPITVSEAITLKKSLYLEYLKGETHIKPIAHVAELIADLYINGFVLALASSSPMEQIEYVLNRFELKGYFRSIVSGESVSEGKPNPEIFLKTSEYVGVDPDSCVVIEDSLNGVTAAKIAGMKCIGYRNSHSGNQDLSRADFIINSFKELNINMITNL
jgi:HAD superfamily hydrolase (TIGR01509 family)